jgi:hypothetical protein
MELNIDLDVSFCNVYYWAGIWEMLWGIKSMEVYVLLMIRPPVEFSAGVTLVYCTCI